MKQILSPQKRHVESRFEDQVMMYFRIILIFGVMFVGVAYLAGAQEDAKADIYEDNQGGLGSGCNSTVTTNCGAAYNISVSGLEETQDLTEKSGTVSGVIVAALVITILLAAFFGVFALTRRQN